MFKDYSELYLFMRVKNYILNFSKKYKIIIIIIFFRYNNKIFKLKGEKRLLNIIT